jgi:O-methyltransferase
MSTSPNADGLTEPAVKQLRESYITLLKKALTMTLWDARDGSLKQPSGAGLKTRAKELLKQWSGAEPPPGPDAKTQRLDGRDWPRMAHTMIGLKRMENLQFCVEDVIQRGIPGDLIETGVWRGGACIFMRGILKAHQVTDRVVWVADSFAGLPTPDEEKYEADRRDTHHKLEVLAVSLEQVKSNFEQYDLLDGQVRFLKGWFKDTLPIAPIPRLAVARLDGDMYESTMDALTALYPKVSVGGYVIIDDFGVVPGCKKAVEDYRQKLGITDLIQEVDWTGAYWQRTASGGGGS